MSGVTFSAPIVFDKEQKSFTENCIEAVDDYFYYGGPRIHVKDGVARVVDEELSTSGKILVAIKLLSLLIIPIPVSMGLCKLLLNPRDSLTVLNTNPLSVPQQEKIRTVIKKKEKPNTSPQPVLETNPPAVPQQEKIVTAAPEDKIEPVKERKKNPSAYVKMVDLVRLAPDGWLNDECINAYFEVLIQRYGGGFIASSYLPTGKTPPSKFLRNRDGYAPDALFENGEPIYIPVNAGKAHWALLKVDPVAKKMYYYDSLSWGPGQQAKEVIERLQDEAADSDVAHWPLDSVRCPRQENGSDCGVFICMALEHLLQGLPLTYSVEDVPEMRRRMSQELLTQLEE